MSHSTGGNGGAAIGARRLYSAMKNYGVNCEMLVVKNDHPQNTEPTVYERKAWRVKLAAKVYAKLNKLHKTKNPVLKSYNLMPTGLHKVINESDADIVQCHWLGANTLSIPEFRKINKPVFWKLPDMWAINGAEHYDLHEDSPRFSIGYNQKSKQTHETGFDLNKWIWRYKKRHWSKERLNLNIVCPSKWLEQCVSNSVLMRNRPVRQIFNPIDTNIFKPVNRDIALNELGLSHLKNKRIISFGADGATTARRKGYHHLIKAIKALSQKRDDCVVLIFGGPKKDQEDMFGFHTYSLGRVDDVNQIVKLYSVSDVFVLPTERDNLPNVIKEAMVCGTPCVAFNVGGVPDMIEHKKTGYLVNPFDTDELAQGINWILENSTDELINNVTKTARSRHNQKLAVINYLKYYQTVLPGNAHLKEIIENLE